MNGASVFLIFSHSFDLEEIARALKVTSNSLFALTAEKSIKIDDVRRLQSELTTRGGGERTIVIYPAEKITIPAQQALLKLLEEPPANTTIYLAGQSTRDVLPTILSRCEVRTVETAEQGSSNEISDHPYCLLQQKSAATDWRQKVMLVAEIMKEKDQLTSVLQDEIRRHHGEPKWNTEIPALLSVMEAMKANVSAQLAVEEWVYKNGK